MAAIIERLHPMRECAPETRARSVMSVQVEIPTVLRPYTAGERQVAAEGTDLSQLISDLDSRHSGLADRLLEDGRLRRFVNVYPNDEDVRFPLRGWPRRCAMGTSSRSCLRSPAADRAVRFVVGLGRSHPTGGVAVVTGIRRPAVGQARGPQPDRLGGRIGRRWP